MKKNRLFGLLSIAVIFVFIISLFSTVNVLADDSTPPAPTEEPVQPPAEDTATETESAPESTLEADLTEIPVADTENSAQENPTENPEAVATPAEILESAPEGMDVVVLDANGEALPLATEEAAQIIMSGDPMWCPDGVLPGGAGCTASYSSFSALLTAILIGGGTYSGNGIIYVAQTYDSSLDGTSVTLDNNVSYLNNLTIQGGWNGVLGSATVVGQSTFDNTTLNITNWVGNVTVNNIFIDNAAGTGLSIDTSGNVNLDYVDVVNSDNNGANIQAGGNVSVTNSNFENNGIVGYSDSNTYIADDGLLIDANGNVTLNNVHASDNGGNGANIFANNVEITDSGFSNNGWGDGYGSWLSSEDVDVTSAEYSIEFSGGDGLYVDSSGNITINDICSCDNAGDGAELYALGNIAITSSSFIGNGGIGYLNITDQYFDDGTDFSADFSLDYQAGDGIYADAGGTLTLTDVLAAENANDGANVWANGNILINDESVFAENGWSYDGFFSAGACDSGTCGFLPAYDFLIDNFDGTAFCQTIDTAGYSYEAIVFNPCEDFNYIEAQGSSFEMNVHSESDSTGGSNSYYINQDSGSGLEAESENGSVTLNQVGVYENAGDGASLNAQTQISVIDSEFYDNGYQGYSLVGEGLSGSISYFSAGGIVGFYYGDGLSAYSSGNITLSQVSANGNGFDGANIGAGGSIFVEDSEFISNGNFVDIGGEGLFGDFLCDQMGMCSDIELPASGFEMEMGIYEDASGDDFGINLDFASGSGVVATASGNITLTDVLSADNLGYGADLYSNSNISITDSEFYVNGYGFFGGFDLEATDDYLEIAAQMYSGSGLYANASNDITLNGVFADGNSLYGAELYSGAQNSVFVQDSEFNSNGSSGIGSYTYHYEDDSDTIDEYGEWYGSGLYIESNGNVTLINVDANGNYQDGAEVYSNGGRIIISCGHYDGNDEYGVYAEDASSLGLYGPEILGNGNSPDEYFFGGSVILSDDCTIPEDKHEKKEIIYSSICEGSDTTAIFVLSNGDFVAFPCPINDYAFVKPVLEKDLPGKLEDNQKFQSALQTSLIRDGVSAEELEEPALISFIIPKDVDSKTLTILFWDGTQWSDLGGNLSADGLHFEVYTKLVGTFVLVSE